MSYRPDLQNIEDVVDGAPEPYRIRQLLGRCANGFERDRGRRTHALPYDSYTAFCGATYGKRSAGWSDEEESEVTCPRCIKKLARTHGGTTSGRKQGQASLDDSESCVRSVSGDPGSC